MPWLLPHTDLSEERPPVPNGILRRAAARKKNAAPERLEQPSAPSYPVVQFIPIMPPRVCWTLLTLLLVCALLYEAQTSALQSYVFSRYSARLSYEIAADSSPQIVFPAYAPYDRELGYSLLPEFSTRLGSQAYRITEQARMTEPMVRIARLGITPPYAERASGGIVIRAAAGEIMLDGRRAERRIERFEDIPPLAVQSLLFIENRDLLNTANPRRNPAIEWERLSKAGLLYLGRQLGMDLEVEGGSTLATQIEKFRHSPGGRTASALDKLRQMTAASLKAYRQGPDTRAERRRIVVDYLNSMPLAAVPQYGEVQGLGEGLRAWFGLDLEQVRAALAADDKSEAKVQAFKHVLALLCAVRAPTQLLVNDRVALDARIASYTRLMERDGVIASGFGRRVRATPLKFAESAEFAPQNAAIDRKAVNAVRMQLLTLLGVPGLYALDRLDLDTQSTIDLSAQRSVDHILRQLRDPEFLSAHGLRGERLLSQGDPRKVVYSVLLYEVMPQGNLLRVQADSVDRPFDLNTGMKMALGSTAKLRTVAHYLEVVSELYATLKTEAKVVPDDPITLWAAQTLEHDPAIGLEAFLQRALDRSYSANPGETFFTGGGAHMFRNFDSRDNLRVLSVRTALLQSTNLVFIRLMRDLVRFHAARLSYDAAALVTDPMHPQRRRLLEEIADEEATLTLARAYQDYRGLHGMELIRRSLHGRLAPRRLAVLFYSWHRGADERALAQWLDEYAPSTAAAEVHRLARAYGNPRLTLADYGYLLNVHPLEVWCAGELSRAPLLPFEQLNARATDAKRVSSAWLFHTRNRKAQDLRLRIRVEHDAFARMTPYWQRFGFPFDHLVPSYATAIGSSSDRPAALAELMGIIVNEGVRRPPILIERLRFASGTPYHTVFEHPVLVERVMEPAVAQVLQGALADVVEYGTARRIKDVFRTSNGSKIRVGGKTGTGDNRYETFARSGYTKSSRAVNRTATFVFYIDHRYYGVVTASVDGAIAQNYRFTSVLPLEVLKLLAPQIKQDLAAHHEGADT